jgi:hypothetical protein
VTATIAVQAEHREFLLRAYAAYNSQDIEALVVLVSDEAPLLQGESSQPQRRVRRDWSNPKCSLGASFWAHIARRR